jgi:methyltransferase (TIGR00027 family)
MLGERGRNPFNARSTAEVVCALRASGAFESDAAVRCPDYMAAGMLGGVNVTSLAKHRMSHRFLRFILTTAVPGCYGYETMRTKFIDDVVLSSVDAGLDELIILGAGFDTRPYRLAHRLQDVRILEVDHPASQLSKRARLKRLLGQEPEHVTYVPIDFAREDVGERLEDAGHHRSARSLFIWIGVTPYLTEAAVAKVLTWIGTHESPRTSITFDTWWAEAIDGSRKYRGSSQMRKAAASVGEPLQWGIPEGQVEKALSHFGLNPIRILTSEEGRSLYLRCSNGSLHEAPMGFCALIHACASPAAP